jgi:hypothetical protein
LKAAALFAATAGIIVAGALPATGASDEPPTHGRTATGTVITIAGTGMGTVTDPGAFPPISCPPACSGTHAVGSEATLTATAAPGSFFQGFTGITCIGAKNPCQYNVGATTNEVTATFNTGTDDDADGDGVPNDGDVCPHRPGPAGNAGCPTSTSAPVDARCERARAKLRKARRRLAALERRDASDERIERAQHRVRKANRFKRRACA